MWIKNFFFEFPKRRIIKRNLKNYLNTPKKGSDFLYEQMDSILCIVDLDIFPKYYRIYKMLEHLNVNSFTIIGTTSSVRKKNESVEKTYDFPILYKDDFNWHGVITNKSVKDILGKKFDLLLNYFCDDKTQNLLLSSKVSASLKAGFSTVDFGYNDLIINEKISDIDAFTTQLLKYIKILNKPRRHDQN